MPTKRTNRVNSRSARVGVAAQFALDCGFFQQNFLLITDIDAFEQDLQAIGDRCAGRTSAQLRRLLELALRASFLVNGEERYTYEQAMIAFMQAVITSTPSKGRPGLYVMIANQMNASSEAAVVSRNTNPSEGVSADEPFQPEVMIPLGVLLAAGNLLSLTPPQGARLINILLQVYQRNRFQPVIEMEAGVDEQVLQLLSRLLKSIFTGTETRGNLVLRSTLLERMTALLAVAPGTQLGYYGTQLWLSLLYTAAPYLSPTQFARLSPRVWAVLSVAGGVAQPNQDGADVLSAKVTALGVLARAPDYSQRWFKEWGDYFRTLLSEARLGSTCDVVEVFCGPTSRLEAMMEYISSIHLPFDCLTRRQILEYLFFVATARPDCQDILLSIAVQQRWLIGAAGVDGRPPSKMREPLNQLAVTNRVFAREIFNGVQRMGAKLLRAQGAVDQRAGRFLLGLRGRGRDVAEAVAAAAAGGGGGGGAAASGPVVPR